MDHFPRYLLQADIVIVSTAAPHHLVTAEQVEAVLEERRQEPMFFIDISVPRNVDPAIDRLENVYLYNIDDLQQVVQTNLRSREEEARKADVIVEAEVEQFFRTVGKLDAAPVIADLVARAEGLRDAEMKRLLGRLPNLSENEVKELERFAGTVVRKLLNDPILFVKEEGDDLTPAERAEWLRRIFRLRNGKGEA
jgi:glutamyl-tRNA reductase